MKIMIDCPNEGLALFTGFDMDEASFARSTLRNNSVYCPHCNVQHVWNKDDAYLLTAPTMPTDKREN